MDRTAEDIAQDRKIAALDKSMADLTHSLNNQVVALSARMDVLAKQCADAHGRLLPLEAQPWWLKLIAAVFRR